MAINEGLSNHFKNLLHYDSRNHSGSTWESRSRQSHVTWPLENVKEDFWRFWLLKMAGIVWNRVNYIGSGIERDYYNDIPAILGVSAKYRQWYNQHNMRLSYWFWLWHRHVNMQHQRLVTRLIISIRVMYRISWKTCLSHRCGTFFLSTVLWHSLIIFSYAQPLLPRADHSATLPSAMVYVCWTLEEGMYSVVYCMCSYIPTYNRMCRTGQTCKLWAI